VSNSDWSKALILFRSTQGAECDSCTPCLYTRKEQFSSAACTHHSEESITVHVADRLHAVACFEVVEVVGGVKSRCYIRTDFANGPPRSCGVGYYLTSYPPG